MPSLDEQINLKKNSQHYDEIADAWQYLLGYNFHWGLFESDSDSLKSATDRLIDLLIEHIPLTTSTHLLDVGCGTGGPARYIARKKNTLVTGFSTSAEGIDRARAFAAREGNPDLLMFEVRDALNNGWPDEKYSAAILLEMSHLIRDKKQLILETSRAVEIGGRVSLCDLVLRRRLTAREIVDRQAEIRLLETCFGKARLEPLESYRPLFETSGLDDIETFDLSAKVIPTIEHWKTNARSNAKELSKYVSAEHVNNFMKSCDILMEFFQNDVWGYGYISGVKKAHIPVQYGSNPEGQRLF